MTALSVLIVEDDALIGMLVGEMLADMGYDVCGIAATEDDAVSDAALHKPDLMIVDEQLREGSGVSAVERILRGRSVPCVFISGAPKRPIRLGMRVLQKPFIEADLIRAIQGVIGASEPAVTRPPAPPRAVIGH
jgi:DNA-binding response OmpR family regulator